MGALAPVTPWIPEDDLLLKNAVEAGASLESLAKGAVQFSRKFSIRELQERWHSLLYDPIVSEEAALRMIELEHASSTLTPRFTRCGNLKDSKSLSGKRKAESVRSCYYASRKRIRNEPFDSMDLSFLMGPINNNYGGEGDPLPGHCMLDDPEADMDMMRQTLTEIGVGNGDPVFNSEFQNTVQGDFPMQQDGLPNEMVSVMGETLSHAGNVTVVEEFGQPDRLPLNSNQVQGCSNFDEDQEFSSQPLQCGSSYNLEYSSPLPEIPLWKSGGGMPLAVESVDIGLRGKELRARDGCSLPSDTAIKESDPSGYGMVHADSDFKIDIPNEELKHASPGTDGYLAQLSHTLLNCTNEDEFLFMDVDGKDDKSIKYYEGLSSLLLSSPNEVNQDGVSDVIELEMSVAVDHPETQLNSRVQVLDEGTSLNHGRDAVCITDKQSLDSPSTSKPEFPELTCEVICVLNTEDPEVPCNDHVVFTNNLRSKAAASLPHRSVQHPKKLNSNTKEIPNNQQSSKGSKPLMTTRKDLGNSRQSQTSSQMIRSQVTPEVSQPHCNRRVRVELSRSDSSRRATIVTHGSAAQAISINNGTTSQMPVKLKEETTLTAMAKPPTLMGKQPPVSNGYKRFHETSANGVKQEIDASPGFLNNQGSIAEVEPVDISTSEQGIKNMSEPEDAVLESDDDVPCFSDIEALILEMDLDPEDQDLFSNEQVLRYQQEETKRAIMRLEQSAHACMQRAIESHGAFAVLYGRHSKHYIKKSEVVLGRATDDVTVDIDLSREGRANKISRRQAIISLDKSGCFHVKNVGKFCISVNDKEITNGQSLTLTSSCLIEIRGKQFIFEINPRCVKRFLESTTTHL
ncbi:Microspherule protein 1 [Linum perenne]